MSERNYNSYTIKLPQFEGPFDLLLFFIQRDELDINNIPIAKITDDFLAYVRQMDALNIDLASEFIVVAATLMRIKTKMMLPRKQVDEQGNEIDPREELVQKLMEYKQYKETLEEFRTREQDRSSRHERGMVRKEIRQIADIALVDVELESLTLFKILKAFERVMDQYENRQTVTHRVINFSYTIQEQQAYLASKIAPREKVSFEEVFAGLDNRIHAIITFLALLEMLNQQSVALIQGEGANEFWLSAKGEEEE
ncbi:MAG: segregation/condensation protein A [Saprospiraceae bacterium]|nr:segregation/condensation protein A [Saprospiraceae bacterium]